MLPVLNSSGSAICRRLQQALSPKVVKATFDAMYTVSQYMYMIVHVHCDTEDNCTTSKWDSSFLVLAPELFCMYCNSGFWKWATDV